MNEKKKFREYTMRGSGAITSPPLMLARKIKVSDVCGGKIKVLIIGKLRKAVYHQRVRFSIGDRQSNMRYARAFELDGSPSQFHLWLHSLCCEEEKCREKKGKKKTKGTF